VVTVTSKLLGIWGPVTALQVGADVVVRIQLSGEPDGAYICCNHIRVYVRGAEWAKPLHRSDKVLVELDESGEVIPLGHGRVGLSEHSLTGASGTKRWLHFSFALDREPARATLLRIQCVRRPRLYWKADLQGVFGAGFEAELTQLTRAAEQLLALGVESTRLKTSGYQPRGGLGASLEQLLEHPADVRERMQQVARKYPKRWYSFSIEATRVDVPTLSVVQAIHHVFDEFPLSFRESSQVSVVQASLSGQSGLLRFCERWCKTLKYVQADHPGPHGDFIEAGPYSSHSPGRYSSRRAVRPGRQVLSADAARAGFDRFLLEGVLQPCPKGAEPSADRDAGFPLLAR
jgi:hypothetical protein